MIKKSFHFSFKILAEILVGVLVLVLISAGFLAWKLSKGPIDLSAVIPQIQKQINTNSDQKIEIGSLNLEWQGFQNPLGLEANQVKISNQRGPYLFSPEIDLNISMRSLLIGKLKFEALWIRRIVVSITRTVDGKIQVTGQESTEAQSIDVEKPSAVPATVTLKNLIYDLPEFDTLWIDQAKVIYRDLQKDNTHIFDPATVFAEMHDVNDTRNISGFLTFPFGHQDNKNEVKVNFTSAIDADNASILNISGALNETPIDSFFPFLPPLPNAWDLNMVVNAQAQATLSNLWVPQKFDLTIDAPRGQIHFPLNDMDTTIDVADFSAHVIQNPQTKTIAIDHIQTRVNNTTMIKLSGKINRFNTPEKLSGHASLSVIDLPQSYLKTYWPKDHSDNGAYRWLVEKMQNGDFKTATMDVSFDRSQITRDDEKPLPPWLLSAKGEFSYNGLTIDYRAPMAEAKNVKGTGVFDDIALTLNVESANIGGMDTRGATLYFDDLLTKGEGVGTLKFPVTAKAQDVFDYISTEPIAAFKKVAFKPKNTKGDVSATVDITIPLLKDLPIEEVKVAVNGTLKNADIPNAVRGLTLSGGPFDINATTKNIKVAGTGLIAGQPVTLDWHEYFSTQNAKTYLSKITAKATTNDTVRRAFTNDFADYFAGEAPITVTYQKSLNGRTTDIDLSIDLTDSAVTVGQFGIEKHPGERATATLDMHLRNDDLASIKNLKIKGSTLNLASGEMAFDIRNGEPVVTSATFKNIAFDENRLSILLNEDNNIRKINVTGSFLDARPFLSGKKDDLSDNARTIGRVSEIGVDVLDMRTADSATIKNPKIYVRLNGMGAPERFEMDARLGDNGTSGDLFVRYTPEVEDALTLRVESNNAGATLRAFDLYPYINGGTLQIAGVPLSGGRFGDVRGQARIDNFSVSKAPVLLRLVNALSFQNFLDTGALKFARLESDFQWQLNDNGDVYTITNGTTSGASVALTFDGEVNTITDNVAISGTAAPLSELNNFIGKIPILGDILTGGGGAFLAATYTVKGNTKDPAVSVNPLSVLTPGIIRKMLFE